MKALPIGVLAADYTITVVILAIGIPWMMFWYSVFNWIFSAIAIIITIYSHIRLKDVSVSICMSTDKNGEKHLDLEKWDEHEKNLRNCFRNKQYWVLTSIGLALAFLWGWRGFIYLAAAKIFLAAAYGLQTHRIWKYLSNEENRAGMGAAAYIYGIQQFFSNIEAAERKEV
jgi:hypothetical protein